MDCSLPGSSIHDFPGKSTAILISAGMSNYAEAIFLLEYKYSS